MLLFVGILIASITVLVLSSLGRSLAGALCVRTQSGPLIKKEPFANNWCSQSLNSDVELLSSENKFEQN